MKTHADREATGSRRTAAAEPETRRDKAPAQAGNTRDAAVSQRLAAAFGPAVAQRAGEEEEPLQGRFAAVQRVEEEEPLQGRFDTVQRVEEEEPLQGRFDTVQRVEEEEPLQGRFDTLQRVEEEEPLQGRFDTAQRVEDEEPLQGRFAAVQLKQADDGGLPGGLKSGVEQLSGVSMDGVQVHYNSGKPAQLNALAYAQGRDIHVAPGQEAHLPHEAWHVAQQAQGRVQATTQMAGGVAVNDDASLEHEADAMGARALALAPPVQQPAGTAQLAAAVAQMRFEAGSGAVWHVHKDHVKMGTSDKSRVDFTGRSKAQILQKLADTIERHGLNIGGDMAASYGECVTWINANC